MTYHDTEWGVPVHDDRRLFEALILEGAQAGLSWITVLRKRETYRAVYEDFDIERVARFNARKRASLLKNPGIIRNRLKVEASVTNARAALDVQAEHGSLDTFLWGYVGGSPIVNFPHGMDAVPARTEVSDNLSRDLKRFGFKFVGSTICYAFMQAVGMVNDHLTTCFRHSEVQSIQQSHS